MALTISSDVPSRVPELIGVCVTFGLLTAIIIALRLWARLKILGQGLQVEDWTILVAAGLALYFCANVPQQTTYGLGYHIYDLTVPSYFSGSLQLFYVGELVYYVCVTVTKFSLLTLYLRFFTTKELRMAAYAAMVFVTLTGISFVIVVVFQCKPIPYAWNKAITGGKCVNVTAVFYSHAAINILTDFVIYIMPMKVLWSIARPKKDKIGLLIVFAIGFFVCIAGIIRLWALQRTSVSNDPSWDNEPSAVWSIIECCVGVICASVPSLKPLFSKVRKATNNSSFKLSDNDRENSKMSGRRGTASDLEHSTSKWNVELPERNNIRGAQNSPASSERNLVNDDLHAHDNNSKSGIYKSTEIYISHADKGKLSERD